MNSQSSLYPKHYSNVYRTQKQTTSSTSKNRECAFVPFIPQSSMLTVIMGSGRAEVPNWALIIFICSTVTDCHSISVSVGNRNTRLISTWTECWSESFLYKAHRNALYLASYAPCSSPLSLFPFGQSSCRTSNVPCQGKGFVLVPYDEMTSTLLYVTAAPAHRTKGTKNVSDN